MIALLAATAWEGLSEYQAIRQAYQKLPRFSYTAVSHFIGSTSSVQMEGNVIRGRGYRLEKVFRANGEVRRISLWKGPESRVYVWIQERPDKTSREYRGTSWIYGSDLFSYSSPREPMENFFQESGRLPIAMIINPQPEWTLEFGHLNFDHVVRLPDVQIGKRSFRQLEITSGDPNQRYHRGIFTYDPQTLLIHEYRHDWRQEGVFRPTNRTLFTYRNARGLRGSDVVRSGRIPAFPKFALKPASRPEPAKPLPNTGQTAEEILQQVSERYRGLATYRDTLVWKGSGILSRPFRMEMAMDRKVGSRTAFYSPFESAIRIHQTPSLQSISVNGPSAVPSGFYWQTSVRNQIVTTRVGADGGLSPDQLTVGGRLIDQAWHHPDDRKLLLELIGTGWMHHEVVWLNRKTRILSRPVSRFSPSHVPQPPIPDGTEEVWIDAASGFIVRSRRFGPPFGNGAARLIYDVSHRPEANVKLHPDDLSYTSQVVDAITLAKNEASENPGRFVPFGGFGRNR